MEQEFNHQAARTANDERPTVNEVVERLGRMWAVSTPEVFSPGELSPGSGPDEGLRGLKFGRFQLRGLRGQGAFGVVYLARDTQLDRDVAIKVPRTQVLADADKRRRFKAEAATAAMLDHAGIITVYEADLASPTPYIASALCPGPDLGEWLAAVHPAVSWQEAATFVAALADAVEYAHRKGVFHRDLKPSNVLLAPLGDCPHFVSAVDDQTDWQSRKIVTGKESVSGEMGTVPLTNRYGPLAEYQPKITDFGLAKLAQAAATDTRSSMLLGTPLYMAPEQLEANRDAAPAAGDVYSLGCILYELVTGRPPIEGDSYIQILDRLRDQPPAPLRRLAPGTPKDLERVSAKCLEKDPAARYASAGELAADLRACVNGAPIQSREAGWISRFKYWCTRPQRIRDAGWYTLCVEMLLVGWTGLTIAGASRFDAYSAIELRQLAIEFVLLMLVVNVPMMIVGWYTTRNRGWAIYAGLVLTIVNMLLPLAFVVITDRLFFAAIYAKIDSSQFYAFSSGTLVFLAELGQLVLYVIALAAWRASRRQEAKNKLLV